MASTDVKELSMNTAEEDLFSQISRAGSTAEGTWKFHMREKHTLPKTLFLPHVRQRSKRQREEQAQFCIYGIWVASSTQLRVQFKQRPFNNAFCQSINLGLELIKSSWFKSLVHQVEVVTTQRRQVLMPFCNRLEANSTRRNTLKCSYQVPS